jgi:hypothetical protein
MAKKKKKSDWVLGKPSCFLKVFGMSTQLAFKMG